jgi:succinate-acetate transporter protein
MRRKNLVVIGTFLLVGGIIALLAGVFVLTKDARHHDISAVAVLGFWLFVAGLVLFVALGIDLVVRRLRRAGSAVGNGEESSRRHDDDSTPDRRR